ncbi:MAG: hypothetical protein HRU03_00110 [Nanoarchaeales archaeon]|nr:hypothetical protein [Nanoarchaeales archaeon]
MMLGDGTRSSYVSESERIAEIKSTDYKNSIMGGIEEISTMYTVFDDYSNVYEVSGNKEDIINYFGSSEKLTIREVKVIHITHDMATKKSGLGKLGELEKELLVNQDLLKNHNDLLSRNKEIESLIGKLNN